MQESVFGNCEMVEVGDHLPFLKERGLGWSGRQQADTKVLLVVGPLRRKKYNRTPDLAVGAGRFRTVHLINLELSIAEASVSVVYQFYEGLITPKYSTLHYGILSPPSIHPSIVQSNLTAHGIANCISNIDAIGHHSV